LQDVRPFDSFNTDVPSHPYIQVHNITKVGQKRIFAAMEAINLGDKDAKKIGKKKYINRDPYVSPGVRYCYHVDQARLGLVVSASYAFVTAREDLLW
jgi:hypothetical protein